MKEEDIIRFLRQIGEAHEGDISLECGRRGYCPTHNDCGVCRYKYMKKKGWLSDKLDESSHPLAHCLRIWKEHDRHLRMSNHED